MLKFNSKKYLFLILLGCILYNCQQHDSLNWLKRKKNTRTSLGPQSDMNSNSNNISESKLKNFLVVLHGHRMNNQNTPAKDIGDNVNLILEENAKIPFTIFKPTCRQNEVSDKLSILDQSRLVVNELQAALKAYLRKEFPKWSEIEIAEGVKKVPVYLLGNSQGGLVALMIGYNQTKKSTHPKVKINLKRIIACSTPTQGLELLSNAYRDAQRFVRTINNILPQAYNLVGSSKKQVTRMPIVLGLARCLPAWLTSKTTLGPGLLDMHPRSKTIQQVVSFINDPKHGIPICLIGGKTDKISKYISKNNGIKNDIDPGAISQESKNLFDENYAQVVTGKKDGKHDGIISLDSQLCDKTNIEFHETTKGDVINKDNKVTRILLSGDYIHCYNFTLNDKLGFNEKSDTTVVESKRAAKYIAADIH
ncbi:MULTISPECIES: hypothetical protein [unclassified Candidatus Cardinium]|uniref:hypothetical protein n=1 Tax=unclassified Candidatus Cardinium TaxID=2641185 RepID=UPI001FB4D95B|nr:MULTISPECIES: hypothetical protein [unclassified Candidatus Cardinium]